MKKSQVQRINFYSDILEKNMSLLVYLPKCYDLVNPLPVLYFFHGRSGCENIMHQLNIQTTTDQMIENGQIKPMIIVCPNMENSRGLNSARSATQVTDPANENRIIHLGQYEEYFMKEIIPLIEKTFHTSKHKKMRYIGGVSAGGYIALHNALHHQQMFSKVGGHMPVLELSLDNEDTPYYNHLDMWMEYNPIYIAKNNNISNSIKIYLDAGDNDEGKFYEGCSVLYDILNQKGINVQNHVFPGHHNIQYVLSNIKKYLKFYSD